MTRDNRAVCCLSEPLQRPGLREKPTEENLLRLLLAAVESPDAVVEEFVVGSRFVAVLADGRVGLASTLGARRDSAETARLARLPGEPLLEAARLLLCDDALLASVGLAALNAGLSPPGQASEVRSQEWLVELCRGREAVVVGDFPFTARLSSVASELHLMELRAIEESTPASQWGSALASCQVAVITGTALLTRSLTRFLAGASQAVKVVIGPSTPLSSVLFDQGAEILAGCRVSDPLAVLRAVRDDGSFREIKKSGVRLIAWARPGSNHEL